MEIIVEYVLLDNLVVDGILLYCTNKILKIPISWWCLCGASIFASLFALFSPMLNFNGFVWVIVKVLVAFIIVLICNINLYKIVLRTVCFVMLTFLFGGMMIALCYFAGTNVIEGATLMYFSKLPIGAILGGGVVFVILMLRIIKNVYMRVRFSQYLTLVSLTINNKTIDMQGYLDTGNNLCTKDHKPIVIIREDELRHWFSCDERMYIMMGKYDIPKIKNPQKVHISSVASKSDIFVFDADNICINNRDYAVAVGVDNSRHFRDFAVLLNNKMGEVLCSNY